MCTKDTTRSLACGLRNVFLRTNLLIVVTATTDHETTRILDYYRYCFTEDLASIWLHLLAHIVWNVCVQYYNKSVISLQENCKEKEKNK